MADIAWQVGEIWGSGFFIWNVFVSIFDAIFPWDSYMESFHGILGIPLVEE